MAIRESTRTGLPAVSLEGREVNRAFSAMPVETDRNGAWRIAHLVRTGKPVRHEYRQPKGEPRTRDALARP